VNLFEQLMSFKRIVITAVFRILNTYQSLKQQRSLCYLKTKVHLNLFAHLRPRMQLRRRRSLCYSLFNVQI